MGLRAPVRGWRSDRTPWLIVGVILVAAGLRFYHLASQPLWYDELAAVSLATVQGGVKGIWSVRYYPHPPLFAILLRMVFKGFTPGEFSARLLPVVSGLVAFPLLYRYTADIASRRTALVAVMLLALSPFHIFFSQDTRPYTLMFTLVVLTLWVLHRALETNGALWWVAHGACILALLYLHFFDWSIVAGEVLYILLCWRRYRRGLVPFGLSLLACVLAVPPVYNLLLDSQGIGRLLVLDAVPVSISFASTWKTLATGESWYVSRLVRSVAVVALGLLGMAGCVHWGRRQPRVLVLMLSMLAVPFLSVFVVLRVLGYVVPPYEERQFMIVLPIVLVLVASGVEFLRRSQGPRVAAKLGPALAACLLVVLLGSNVMALGGYYTRFEKNRDIRVIEYLASRVEPGDAIICQGSSMAMNIEFHWDEGIPVELVAYPLSVDGDWRFSRRLSIVPVDSLQWDVSMDDLLSHPRVWLVAQDGFDSPEFATEMQNVAPLVLVAPVAPFTVYLFAP